jgi:hypothetical protein
MLSRLAGRIIGRDFRPWPKRPRPLPKNVIRLTLCPCPKVSSSLQRADLGLRRAIMLLPMAGLSAGCAMSQDEIVSHAESALRDQVCAVLLSLFPDPQSKTHEPTVEDGRCVRPLTDSGSGDRI